jgi:hypothetical protein
MSDNAYLSNEPFPPELKIRDSLAPTACLPHQEPTAGRGTPTPNGPFGVGVSVRSRGPAGTQSHHSRLPDGAQARLRALQMRVNGAVPPDRSTGHVEVRPPR